MISGIDGSRRASLDSPVTFAITVSNPLPNESFTYQFDWDGDGAVDESFGGQEANFITVHVFDEAGAFSPRVRVVDASGTAGVATISPPIIVRAAGQGGDSFVAGLRRTGRPIRPGRH